MNNKDVVMERNNKEVISILKNVIDRGANYVIKSMPVNEHIKNILKDVKKVINEDSFNNILKVAVKSSIKEGIEILNIPEESITEIDKFVDTAFKGGLPNAVSLGLEVISVGKKYGNIFYNYIEDFFSTLKNFICSDEFKKKVYNNINKCLDKVDKFKDLCTDWYLAYDNFNLDNLKDIASRLNKLKPQVDFNGDCVNENNVIQNMTQFADRRKGKLTKLQCDICNNLC